MKDILGSLITIFILFVGFTFLNDYRKNPREIDVANETGKVIHETIIDIKDGWNSVDSTKVDTLR